MYGLLEAFSDGWGGWKFQDVLGVSLVDLDEALVEDLMTLRYLAGIAEKRRSAEKDIKKDG